MTIDRWLAIAGLILAAVGAGPTALAFSRLAATGTVARVLRLQKQSDLCLLVTTAEARRVKRDGGLMAVKRDLVPEGDVSAVVPVASALARFYRTKSVRLFTSEHIMERLDRDLMILGSPASNRWSQEFFDELRLPGVESVTIDVPAGTIKVSSAGPGVPECNIDGFNVTPNADGIPEKDIICIATSPNFLNHNYRCWVIAGFTTYGTAAAARILFDDILTGKTARERSARDALRAPCALIIIRCRLSQFGMLAGWQTIWQHPSKS